MCPGDASMKRCKHFPKITHFSLSRFGWVWAIWSCSIRVATVINGIAYYHAPRNIDLKEVHLHHHSQWIKPFLQYTYVFPTCSHNFSWNLFHPSNELGSYPSKSPGIKRWNLQNLKKNDVYISSQILRFHPPKNLRGLNFPSKKTTLSKQTELPSPVPRRHFRYSGVRFRPPSLHGESAIPWRIQRRIFTHRKFIQIWYGGNRIWDVHQMSIWLLWLPSRKLTYLPPKGKFGKSSTQICHFWWGDMWSFPGRVCSYVKKKIYVYIYIYNIQKKNNKNH